MDPGLSLEWARLNANAAELWRAWRTELEHIIAPYWAPAFADQIGHVVLEFEGNRVRVGNTVPAAAASQIVPADDAETISALLRKACAECGRHQIMLRLPQESVLRLMLTFPNTRAHLLRRVLSHELERVSPLPPDQVNFDFSVLWRDREKKQAGLEVRLVRRDILLRGATLAEKAGTRIADISFANTARCWTAFPVDARSRLLLLWRRWQARLLLPSAGLLLVVLVFALYLRGAGIESRLEAETDLARREVANVALLRREADAAGTQLAFLAEHKRAPSFTQVLSDLSWALPDETWISEFQLAGGRLRIQGSSANATELPGLLERSGHFDNARFESPVTRDPERGSDRIDLSLQLAGGAQ